MEYTTIQGDTWDLIAFKIYKNTKYTKELMHANSQYIDVVIFSNGVKLTVPQILTDETSINQDNLPPWRL